MLKLAERPLQEFHLREFLELIWVNFVVHLRNLVEFLKVMVKYYGNITFLKVDMSLLLMYLFHNPFSISKRFLMRKGESEIYAYGETPLTTLEMIAKECQISSKDVVFELGSGRGRNCFWLNSFIGCKAIGIEYIPDFVERAERIKKKLEIKNVDFRLGDILDADYTGATVLYLYGTCLEDDFIKKLIEKFAQLPVGTKIITVSYPLTDYVEHPFFEVMKRFSGKFPWGVGDVYLQVVKSH
jgi:SAM-dependent methyltransferase